MVEIDLVGRGHDAEECSSAALPRARRLVVCCSLLNSDKDSDEITAGI